MTPPRSPRTPPHVARRLLRAIAGILALLCVLLLVWISRSTVVLTGGGVYDQILIPVGSGAIRWRADQARVAPAPQLDGVHGPVVRRLASGDVEVTSFCGNRVRRDTVRADSVRIECADRAGVWRWRGPSATPATAVAMAERIAVTSDLEGDSAYFERWARALDIVDSSGRWRYGTGHVVLLGDMTDRGRWVYPLLWRLYALEAEAAAAGGAVHLVLGNHEQYNLVGITKDIEPEHHYAMSRIAPYDVLLDGRTVLGQWLRTRPVALRIGRTLFVHGGISPSVVQRGISLDSLNATSRAFLSGGSVDAASRDAQLGPQSVTQYRGFVLANGDEPLASAAHVEATLRQFDVDRVVIGHTEVDSITPLHDGRIIAVNSTLHRPEALVFEGGVPHVQQLGFRRTPWEEPAPVSRRFSLLNYHDWQALLGVFAKIWDGPG